VHIKHYKMADCLTTQRREHFVLLNGEIISIELVIYILQKMKLGTIRIFRVLSQNIIDQSEERKLKTKFLSTGSSNYLFNIISVTPH